MTGIYKITNLITKQSYIGQSNNIERRWKEHCRPSKVNKSLISNAISSFGKENFSFQILQECKIEELDFYEEFYIKKYNTITPNGYNIESSINGNSRNYTGYSEEMVSNIISDIKNSSLSLTEIANKYSVNKSTVTRINKGDVHRREGEIYPLRERIKKEKTKKQKKYFCIDCGIEISKNNGRCLKCANILHRVTVRPSKEELKNLIRIFPFTKIGKMYGVSDNAIRKWCSAMDLPSKKSEIKKYTEEEWKKI